MGDFYSTIIKIQEEFCETNFIPGETSVVLPFTPVSLGFHPGLLVYKLTHLGKFFETGTSGSSQSLQHIKYMINPGWLLCNHQLCNYVNLYLYSFAKLNIFL